MTSSVPPSVITVKSTYSMPTNFHLGLIIEPVCYRNLFLDAFRERRVRGASEERFEHGEADYHVFNL